MHVICKIGKAAILVFVFAILTGCNSSSPSAAQAVNKEPTKLSAWMAYWELEAGLKDLGKVDKKLENLCYFAAYFDKNDCLFLPQELSDRKSEISKQKGKCQTYLTFVNDKQNMDGSSEVKDIEVLRRVFADDVSMEAHIDEIITLTLTGGYDGIEIDYERVWKDQEVAQVYLKFLDKLYAKALQNKLKLRVVLEPSVPFSSAGFIKGPEYVVMIYNLYGLHSDPGPKAHKAFIKKIITCMQALPGEKSAAFSTGGCLWGENGTKRFLTEIEAKTLAVTHEAETKRDDESQCVVFDYADNGVLFHVWYADVKTLKYWISVAKEQGENNISLWRLGGNIDINEII
ncbi:MAG: hypothetical protein H6Q67_1466 [Firmicutes bacterium]|nr:hypothetical protein [Bacillota bacterium]